MNDDLLTLCLITRNEEARIEGCLASARGIADRVVVLDTGSADATVEIATRMGATVIRRTWDDDFAAARNAALDQVETPWVLVLDADERIAGCDVAELRRMLSEAGAGTLAFGVRIDNRLDGGGVAPFLAVRLFRNLPEIRYRGLIHEEVTSALAERQGGPLHPVAAPLVVEHDGYLAEVRTDRDKHRRNLRLLRRAVKIDPRRALMHMTLARELLIVCGERIFPGEGFAEALEHLQAAAAAAAEEPTAPHLHASITATLAAALTAAARPAEALTVLRDAPLPAPNSAELLQLEFAGARARLALAGTDRAQLTRVEREFAGLVGRDASIGFADMDVRITGVFAMERWAETLGRLGCKSEALAALREAAKAAPDYGGPLVRRAEVHLLHGETRQGIQAFLAALKRDGHDPEAWLGAGRVLNVVGQRAQAIDCARNALKCVPQWGEALLELALYHIVADDPMQVFEEISALRDACCAADVACLVAELAAGRTADPLRDWPRNEVERALLTLTRGVAAAGRNDLLDRLRLPATESATRSARTVAADTDVGFILLSHPRSGANNLLSILNNHPQIATAGEIFNPHDDGPAYVRKLGLDAIVDATDVSRIGEFYAAARERENKPVIGFKLFCHQLDHVDLDRLVGDPAIPKILLRRENLLQAYVSWAVACLTKRWRAKDDAPRVPEPFRLDPVEAAGWLERNRSDLDLCNALMLERGVPFFECTYEHLFETKTLNEIYRFLGVAERDRFEHGYRLQRSREIYERILNREELEDEFGATYGYLIEPTGVAAS